MLLPQTPEELRDAVASAAASGKTVELLGGNPKSLMAGAVERSDVSIGTTRIRRILQYEPRDLTISVEAGLPSPN